MEQQSDTPRTDAAAKRGSDLGGANTMWSGIWPLARDLERELTTATRERDEARAEGERLRGALEDVGRLLHKAEERFREIGQAAWSERMARACDATEIALAATEPKP